MPAIRPHWPGSLRAPNRNAAISGTMNCRTKPSSANSHESGCNRSCGSKLSDATAFPSKQRVAQVQRFRMRQARQLDARVAAACGVELECAHAVTALQRSLRNIRMLDAGARQGDVRVPQHAALYDDADIVDREGEIA